MFNDFSNFDPKDDNNNKIDKDNNQQAAFIANLIQQSGGQDAPDDDNVYINMNDEAVSYDDALFRDDEIEQTINVLNQRKKPNVLLIGDAGVGKTQIAEQIAKDLNDNQTLASKRLNGYTLYNLPLENIVSGKSFVGQLEKELQDILAFMSNPENKAIVFIDEIHRLMGNDETYNKIRQILKPALSRGDLKVIGATTTTESRKVLDDPAFKRRFTRISIPELTAEQTRVIIEKVKPTYETHFGVELKNTLIPRLINLADEYKLANSKRPDNVLTLLDRVMTDAKTELIKAQDIAGKQSLPKPKTLKLNENHLKRSARKMVNYTTHTSKTLHQDLKDVLDEKIVGQQKAKDALVDAIKRKELSLFKSDKPDSFLFAGATGVGKTEIAKLISETLYGKNSLIRLNMTEYVDATSLNRIKGSPDGYVGSTSDKERPFDKMENNPHQVVLLDEFEKAHPNVQQYFMQALDEGFVETERGVTIDFSKAIVIATTNAGVDDLAKPQVGFGKKTISKKDLTQALQQSFKPELINRFKRVIAFEPIEKEDYMKVIAVKYNELVKSLKEEQIFNISPEKIGSDHIDDYAFIKELTNKHFNPMLGARSAKDAVRALIEEKAINASMNNQKTITLQ